MTLEFEPILPDGRRVQPGFRLIQAMDVAINWIVSSPGARPADVQRVLLLQSLTKARTLVISIVASSLMAAVAAVMTAATWAYAWLLAELVVGSLRLVAMNTFVKAESSGRTGNSLGPIFAGLISFIIISAGGYQCVGSGEWPLITMAGMGLATLIGAVSSRNAGTPRYAILLIFILTLPFSLAALTSPMPYLFMIGVQLPLYACGVIFVMLDNYKVLLSLYRSEDENRRLAHHDLLTGLPNRSMNLKRFDELLADLASASDRSSKGFTVFCLDLDGFKDVNDRLGHAAGDAVLVALADRLRESVRVFDFVARTGGDEFVVLLPAISAADATAIAERIIARVEMPFDVGHGEPVQIGISIGSASAPADGESVDALMRSADQAMYVAKRRGKGRFVPHGSRSSHFLRVEGAELAPPANADAGMTACQMEGGGNRPLPLPSRTKSV